MSLLDKINEIKNTLQSASNLAKKTNIDGFEIHCSFDQGHVINTRNLITENLEFNITQSLSVKVYNNGKSGYAETSDLSIKSIQSTIDHAKMIAQFTEIDPFSGIIEKDLLCSPTPLDYIYRPWNNCSIDNMIDIANECEQHILDNKKIQQSEGVEFSSFEIITGFTNSHGFLDVFPETRYSISAGCIAKDKTGMQRDGAYFTNYSIDRLPDIKEVSDLAIQRTLSKLDPQSIKSQSLPVILSPSIAKQLIGSMLSAINGRKQFNKNTFLHNKLNKKICSQNINITEKPDIVDGMGSQPYDAEGVNKGNNPIIIDGLLQRYILSSYSAKQLKMETTGNAGGISNIVISSSNSYTKHDLYKELDHGIVIHETMGQGINITTGEYSKGAMGYYVKNGVIQHAINNFTLNGKLDDMLNNIQAICTDDIDYNGRVRTGSILVDNCHIAAE